MDKISDRDNCLNCGQPLHGAYCSNCGQRSDTGRITLRSLSEKLLAGLTDLDRGFFHNLKALTLHPRRIVIDYLKGKRAAVYHPLSYALIAVTLLTLVDGEFARDLVIADTGAMEDTGAYNFGYSYGKFFRENLKFLWLLNILYFSLLSSQVFPRYNFAEHLTIHAFIIGHAALITVLFFPLFNQPMIFNPVNALVIVALSILVFWNAAKKWEVIVLCLVNVFAGYFFFFVVPIPFHWLIMQWG